MIKLTLAKYIKQAIAGNVDFRQRASYNVKRASLDWLKLSIDYGILNTKNAFICEVQEGNDITRSIPVSKVVVNQKKPSSLYRKKEEAWSSGTDSEVDFCDDFDNDCEDEEEEVD